MISSIDDVKQALQSFPRSSSGGIDGIRPGHLKILTSPCTAEAGQHLLQSLMLLVNRILSANLPPIIRDLPFSANLSAFKKKDGGIRPIAVGSVTRD